LFSILSNSTFHLSLLYHHHHFIRYYDTIPPSKRIYQICTIVHVHVYNENSIIPVIFLSLSNLSGIGLLFISCIVDLIHPHVSVVLVLVSCFSCIASCQLYISATKGNFRLTPPSHQPWIMVDPLTTPLHSIHLAYIHPSPTITVGRIERGRITLGQIFVW
jgi:hypothetical protein